MLLGTGDGEEGTLELEGERGTESGGASIGMDIFRWGFSLSGQGIIVLLVSFQCGEVEHL